MFARMSINPTRTWRSDICKEIGPNKRDTANEIPYGPIIWQDHACKKSSASPNLRAGLNHLISCGEFNDIGSGHKKCSFIFDNNYYFLAYLLIVEDG